MPTPLPTIEVNDTQLAKLLEVYGSAENYITWLQDSIVSYVMGKEDEKLRAEYAIELQQKMATARADLLGG